MIGTDRFVAIDLVAPSPRSELRSRSIAGSRPTFAACIGNPFASLVGLAPAVLFSAAIPGQTGLRHVNTEVAGLLEALFAQHGYRAIDPV